MLKPAARKVDKEHQKGNENVVDDLINSSNSLSSKKLDLYKKMINYVPVNLMELDKLEVLYLEGNSLQLLPDDFFVCLGHLKWLDLRRNKLACLPSSIGESRSLRSLLLEENQLKMLPLELGLVRSLSGLHLAANPLEYPPPDIVEQGTQVILAYLREQLIANTEERDQETAKTEDIFDSERSKSEGRDRALQSNPGLITQPCVKLPPINPQVEKETFDDAPNVSVVTHLDFNADATRFRKKGSKKQLSEAAPTASETKNHINNERHRQSEDVQKDNSSARRASRSPSKRSPRRKRKNKTQKAAKESLESSVAMNASLSNTGTFDISYEAITDEKLSMAMQRQDTVAMHEKLKEIIDEEEAKTLKVQALVKPESKPVASRNSCVKFNVASLKEGDMIALRVAEKHYIPGQPCLGKVVSLPDATGLVIVHYYSGRYDGAWRPMMSRSSPYLRRVPASMIVYRFSLTEDSTMTLETIEGLKAAVGGDKLLSS